MPIPCWRRPFLPLPPSVLDVAGVNLPLAGYLVSAFSIVSSLEAWLGIAVPQFPLPVVHGGAPKLYCLVSSGRSFGLSCVSWVISTNVEQVAALVVIVI